MSYLCIEIMFQQFLAMAAIEIFFYTSYLMIKRPILYMARAKVPWTQFSDFPPASSRTLRLQRKMRKMHSRNSFRRHLMAFFTNYDDYHSRSDKWYSSIIMIVPRRPTSTRTTQETWWSGCSASRGQPETVAADQIIPSRDGLLLNVANLM